MKVTTEQARELFGEWAKEVHLSPETTRKYLRMAERHIKFCGSFDTERIDELVKTLRNCDFSYDYVRQNRSFLRRFTAFIESNCKRTVETEQIELPTEEQTAKPARPHFALIDPEIAARIKKLDERANKRAEIMKLFDGIATTAIMNAVAVLTSTCKARTQELYNRKANINWNAEDWQTASSETATLFRNKQEFEKVIAALEAVLNMKVEEETK